MVEPPNTPVPRSLALTLVLVAASRLFFGHPR
jgi:hypothetical protein